MKSSSLSKRSSQRVDCRACRTKEVTIKTPKSNIRSFKPKYDWTIPGPQRAHSIQDPLFQPKENEMLCSLSGHWYIYQLLNGHRYTTDDVFTAAMAVRNFQDQKDIKYMDIGTGLASVLMMVNWALYDKIVKTVGIEAQEIHVELAKKSFLLNGIQPDLYHLDLRSIESLLHDLNPHSYHLITGTPPYFPKSEGVLPNEIGRGYCAFELRGGIEVYFRAASFLLARSESSRFVVCQTSIAIQRTEKVAKEHNMVILERWDVYGIQGKSNPLFCVFNCCWSDYSPQSIEEHYPIYPIHVRNSNGQYSKETLEIMELLGKPIPNDHFQGE